MPRTDSRVSETTSSSPSRPAKPRLMPSTSQLRLSAVSTAARMTAFSPGASPPPVDSASRIRSAGEQPKDFAGTRVPIELGLLEDGLSVPDHLEPALAGRDQLNVRVGKRASNFRRQTDGSRLVVSKRAVFDRYAHVGSDAHKLMRADGHSRHRGEPPDQRILPGHHRPERIHLALQNGVVLLHRGDLGADLGHRLRNVRFGAGISAPHGTEENG